jgi:alkylation response protein AidB-like acyl-CoA dehydrogenase
MAITEPSSGSDTASADLIDMGQVSCHARKEPGGYMVNGTKVFISNAPFSSWHVVLAFKDIHHPSDTALFFVVHKGNSGFSIGRTENKMGQKACPASELIFKDYFVTDDQVCLTSQEMEGYKRPKKDYNMQLMHYVLSVTRAGVGAFGTGAARGAYEAALKFAAETKVNGKLLINHEWAQCMLAEMYKNIALARLSYVETNYANGIYGFYKNLQSKPAYYYNKVVPSKWFDRFASVMDKPFMTKLFRKRQMDGQTDEEIHRTSGWGSLSKFAATDIGIKNCQMALDIMGQAGLRHDRGVEKILRDAKLLQIYEGTNQLNRLNLFNCHIAGDFPQAIVFDE